MRSALALALVLAWACFGVPAVAPDANAFEAGVLGFLGGVVAVLVVDLFDDD